MKKITFFLLIFFLISCGTDYYYSSFYLRKDFEWLVSPSEQENLDFYAQVSGTTTLFNNYTSPVILATPDNYLLVIYETREEFNEDMIGVDGQKFVNITLKASYDATSFQPGVVIGKKAGSGVTSHGSPIGFLTKNGNVVLLSTTGYGFGGGSKSELSRIAMTITTNNGISWEEWSNIETNVFKKLYEKNYDRFYTNPGNGVTLRNGTLVCMIDYRSSANGDKNSPIGAAILYSKDDGKTWELGSTIQYSGHRFAKVIAERTDGKLLIAAVPKVGNNYKQQGKLAWYLADSLNGNISSISVTSPQVDQKDGGGNVFDKASGGVVSGAQIKYTENGILKNGILLLHSYPQRNYNNGYIDYLVSNPSAISISEDDGQTWTMITNIVGKDPQDRASFRHSLTVFKDGTIGMAFEQGAGYEIIYNPSNPQNFIISYRRTSLSALSSGKYRYEGF